MYQASDIANIDVTSMMIINGQNFTIFRAIATYLILCYINKITTIEQYIFKPGACQPLAGT